MSHPMVRKLFHSFRQFIVFYTCSCELCRQESLKGNRALPTKEFVVNFFNCLCHILKLASRHWVVVFLMLHLSNESVQCVILSRNYFFSAKEKEVSWPWALCEFLFITIKKQLSLLKFGFSKRIKSVLRLLAFSCTSCSTYHEKMIMSPQMFIQV